MTIRRAVQFDDIVHSYSSQNRRNSQSAYRVHAVDRYGEMAFLDRLYVHQFQLQHLLDMVWQIILVCHMSEHIHFSKSKIFRFGDSQHTFSFGIVEKLTLLIE